MTKGGEMQKPPFARAKKLYEFICREHERQCEAYHGTPGWCGAKFNDPDAYYVARIE